jgi:hypothetical protein
MTTVTATVWDVLRPPLHAENGRNPAAGTLAPFSVTANVPSSKLQAASSRTATGLLVTRASAGGVGATKARGAGVGSERAGGAVPSTMASRNPRRPYPTTIERMPNLPRLVQTPPRSRPLVSRRSDRPGPAWHGFGAPVNPPRGSATLLSPTRRAPPVDDARDAVALEDDDVLTPAVLV